MLKRRIIPKLQLKKMLVGKREQYVLVNTRKFTDVIRVGDPKSQARIYEAQAVDELIFLDLDASSEARAPLVELIKSVAEEIFMPLTVGGGLASVQACEAFLGAGADKVSINSAALANPGLITDLAKRFGSQCVVASVDYVLQNGEYFVFDSRRKVSTDRPLAIWVKELESRGAGELLMTSVDRDGACEGLDVIATSMVVAQINIPVIASGGVGLASHIADGFLSGGAEAVAAGTFFSLKDQNPIQARSQVANRGIAVRSHLN